MPPSWTIVSTVAEPLPLLMAFVAHHLHLGADGVILHMDVEDEEAANVLSAAPGCTIVPPSVMEDGRRRSTPLRQARNATYSYARVKSDWLLHIDADEFLIDLPRVMGALDNAPSDCLAVGLRPYDRVWHSDTEPLGVFDGTFRFNPDPRQPPADAPIYGEAAQYLDAGLAGNAAEKCFSRTGQDVDIGVHRPMRDGARVKMRVLPKPALLHFDGLTPAQYILKLQRKFQQQPNWAAFPAPGRRAQLLAAWHAGADPDALRALTRAAKCVTLEQERALEAEGRLYRTDFDPMPAIEAVFGRKIDLSVIAFDALGLAGRTLSLKERAINLWTRRKLLKRAGSG